MKLRAKSLPVLSKRVMSAILFTQSKAAFISCLFCYIFILREHFLSSF